MRFISNAGTDRVVDLVRPWLRFNHRVDVVSPSFPLFSFAEVPRPTMAANVCRQLGLLGTKKNRAASAKLEAPWLACKCAAWLDAKAQVWHASDNIPQGTMGLRDDQGTPRKQSAFRLRKGRKLQVDGAPNARH